MKYRDITAQIKSEDAETASSIADMLDFGGMYIEDYSDLMESDIVKQVGLVDEELLKKDRSTAKLHIYIDEDKNAEDCISYLSERFESAGIHARITVATVDEEDYTNCWKKYYKPLKIGKKIVVVPEWEQYTPEKGEIPLIINPGMAFGTGTHETTFMCAQTLQDVVKQNDSVLDVGCGSGILSLVSLLCGASAVFACDIDEGAVKVSRENATLNSFDGTFTSYLGNILDENSDLANLIKGNKYDIVVANIVADVIIALSKIVSDYMKPDALFVMSGIISQRIEDVRKALDSNGFKIESEHVKKDWVCVVATKK